MKGTILPLLSIYWISPSRAGGLWASHHTYPGYEPSVWGVHGQDCTPDSGDFPAGCSELGGVMQPTHGKMECFANFDCCTCGTMLCAPDCTDIVCNGDSGCYGVKDIVMVGDPLGATLNCNGDLSCKWTNVVGTNIGGILCTGDGACAFSVFDMVCIEEHGEGCTLLCVGDDSCRSHISDPTRQAYFHIIQSQGMKCAHDACVDAVFDLMQNLGGAIECTAEEACARAEISINNVETLSCRGIKSCKNAHIFIKNPQEGFSVLCSGRSACEGLELEIMIDDPEITFARGITCMSAQSCYGAHITINTMNEEYVIEELSCGAAEACRHMVFDIGPKVIFENCMCAGGLTMACDNLLGVDQCMDGMHSLACLGANSCKGKIETLTNVGPGFELYCPDPSSCQDMILSVYMNGRRRGVDWFGGVHCGSDNSCNGLIFNIYNIVQGFRIDAGTVMCDAPDACTNAQFNFMGADVSTECYATDACVGCMSTVDGKCTKCGTRDMCSAVGFPVGPVVHV